jgi:hypothetical protein
MVDWIPYQVKRPTREEVTYWFGKRYAGAHIGAITGGTHGYFVVDLDTGWSIEDFEKMNMPKNTLIARTPSGGFHYYYRHPGGEFRVKTKAGILPCIDARGDKGFIVLPPSTYPDGRKYEWINNNPIAIPTQETLAIVQDKPDGERERTDFSTFIGGRQTGGRTDGAVSIAGALLRYQPENQWQSLCWPLVRLWNRQNSPPLDEMKLARDFNGIAQRELRRRAEWVKLNKVKNKQHDAPSEM